MLDRILLIEDAEGEALHVKRMLRGAGLEDPVFWLQDGLSAMAYFNGEGIYADRKKYPLPEVVLLDLKMPEIDGYQFLKWLRSQPELTGIVVIVLTAETNPTKIQMAYQLGATSFLAKDANQEEFRNMVQFLRGLSRVVHNTPRPKAEGGSQNKIA